MPTYDYACARCGDFERIRPVSQRDLPIACPTCAADAPRVLSGAPAFALVSGATRPEERSGAGSYKRMRHPSACPCC